LEIISVCVGSSCYLKGSYEVVLELQKTILEKQLQDKFDVKAEFCQGNCVNAPCVRIGEILYTKVTANEIKDLI